MPPQKGEMEVLQVDVLWCILNVLPTRWWNRAPILSTEYSLSQAWFSLTTPHRTLHVEETQSIRCFQNFCLLSSGLKRQRWERLEKRRESKEIQGRGEPDYVSQKPTGWTCTIRHACVPALVTGRCFHVCESAREPRGLHGAAARLLPLQYPKPRLCPPSLVEAKRR